MRKCLTLTMLTTAVIVSVISCQKETSKPAENNFDASFVKEWYYGTFKKSPEWASSNLKGKKLPDWKHPIVGKLGGYDVVEFPLVKPAKTFSIKADNSLSDADKKRTAEASLSRILFIKKGNEILVREIDYIPDWNYLKSNAYDISKVSVVNSVNNFTGKVKTSKWDGTLLSLGMFEAGKFIKKGKMVNRPGNRTEQEECQYIEYCVWQMDCELIISGDVIVGEVCGPWYNTGECWMEEYCYETDPCVLYGYGCDDDGGDPGEECADEEASLNEFADSGTPISESVSITPVSSNTTTRTKKYTWKFYGVYAAIYANYEFTSNELGVHQYPYGTPSGWKFTSLTHSDIQVSGQSLNWEVQCTRLVPSPSLYTTPVYGTGFVISWGKMKLSYDMKFTTNCGLFIINKIRKDLTSEIYWDVDYE